MLKRVGLPDKQPLRQVKDEEVGGGSFVKPPITAAFYLYTRKCSTSKPGLSTCLKRTAMYTTYLPFYDVYARYWVWK